MAETAEDIKVGPLRPSCFGLIEHAVRRFNAAVPGGLSVDDLENPDLWVNVANKVEMGSEIRCMAEDMSFVAYGICTFAQGSTIKVKILEMHELDAVDNDALADAASDYEVKLRGRKKWCLIKKSDSSVIKEGIATQLQAMKELEDYQKALRS